MTLSTRHTRENGYLWIPACAGMTNVICHACESGYLWIPISMGMTIRMDSRLHGNDQRNMSYPRKRVSMDSCLRRNDIEDGYPFARE